MVEDSNGDGPAKATMRLKPCPFCGSDDVSPSSFDVKCGECGAEMPGGTDAAIAAWNRRADPSPVREAVEALIEQAEHVELGIACKMVDVTGATKELIAKVKRLRSLTGGKQP